MIRYLEPIRRGFCSKRRKELAYARRRPGLRSGLKSKPASVSSGQLCSEACNLIIAARVITGWTQDMMMMMTVMIRLHPAALKPSRETPFNKQRKHVYPRTDGGLHLRVLDGGGLAGCSPQNWPEHVIKEGRWPDVQQGSESGNKQLSASG